MHKRNELSKTQSLPSNHVSSNGECVNKKENMTHFDQCYHKGTDRYFRLRYNQICKNLDLFSINKLFSMIVDTYFEHHITDCKVVHALIIL